MIFLIVINTNKILKYTYKNCHIFDIIQFRNYFIMITSAMIKELRIKMVLSQTEFAKILGVSFESVNRYENDKSNPTIKVRRKLLHLMRDYGMAVQE